MRSELIGLFVTAQNTPTIPHAAQISVGSPRKTDNAEPNVAPINRDGTISPPLNPAHRVRHVNRILRRNISIPAGLSKLPAMISPPSPRYASVPTIRYSTITATPPATTRIYGLTNHSFRRSSNQWRSTQNTAPANAKATARRMAFIPAVL